MRRCLSQRNPAKILWYKTEFAWRYDRTHFTVKSETIKLVVTPILCDCTGISNDPFWRNVSKKAHFIVGFSTNPKPPLYTFEEQHRMRGRITKYGNMENQDYRYICISDATAPCIPDDLPNLQAKVKPFTSGWLCYALPLLHAFKWWSNNAP